MQRGNGAGLEKICHHIRRAAAARQHTPWPETEATAERATRQSGAHLGLSPGRWWCGESDDQRPLRRMVSKHSSASSPAELQNCPGRLHRHGACRQVASTAPLRSGSHASAPAASGR
jgi:hypothetical protein